VAMSQGTAATCSRTPKVGTVIWGRHRTDADGTHAGRGVVGGSHDLQHGLEVAFAEDKDPIEALGTNDKWADPVMTQFRSGFRVVRPMAHNS
jgi:hypothetical protein